jgi:hypothetical protein
MQSTQADPVTVTSHKTLSLRRLRNEQGELFHFLLALLAGITALLIEEGSRSTLKPCLIVYAPQLLLSSSIQSVFIVKTGHLHPQIYNFNPSTDNSQTFSTILLLRAWHCSGINPIQPLLRRILSKLAVFPARWNVAQWRSKTWRAVN